LIWIDISDEIHKDVFGVACCCCASRQRVGYLQKAEKIAAWTITAREALRTAEKGDKKMELM
jgi:hypothetical protein